MGFCTKCGKKLGEGFKFCTNCGAPVGTAAAGQKAGNNTGNTRGSSSRLRIRNFTVGITDYQKLHNISLVTKPSQHSVLHFIDEVVVSLILIYYLIVFGPVFLPLLIQAEESPEIEYVPGMFPGFSVTLLILLVCGIISRKIRHDIFHTLPKGFDYWKIKGILRWHIFGLESLKTAILRLLRKENCNYPELGVGMDDEGNYYAFTVPGKDVGRYL